MSTGRNISNKTTKWIPSMKNIVIILAWWIVDIRENIHLNSGFPKGASGKDTHRFQSLCLVWATEYNRAEPPSYVPEQAGGRRDLSNDNGRSSPDHCGRDQNHCPRCSNSQTANGRDVVNPTHLKTKTTVRSFRNDDHKLEECMVVSMLGE